ncbi:MAG: PAS domain S-box protein [Acidimicrobiales bacterium]
MPAIHSDIRDLARLVALRALRLLDSEPEVSFDALTRLAVRLLSVPVALVSLVDENRQFFKSATGLPEPWQSQRQTPLTHSYCQFVVARHEPLVIEDALLDSDVQDSPAIVDLGARAYLGIPLTTSSGFVLGTFAVIDHEPRRWSEHDKASVADLASATITAIELRATKLELEADVVERRRVERRLREGEKRHRRIIETAKDAFVTMDAEKRVTEWNPGAVSIFGWSRDEAIGRLVEDLIVPERYRREHREGIQAFLDAGGGYVLMGNKVVELPALRRDGTEVLCEFCVWAVPAGRTFEFNAFIRDIELRHRLEEQVRQSQKLEAIGSLAGGVAHDFNNILTAILGHAELALLTSTADTSTPGLRQHIEGIRDAALRAAQLTGQLLAYSRRQASHPEVINLNDAVSEIRSMLERLIEETIEIRVALKPDLPPIRADRGQLGQVLTNLIVNSRDAMPRGGTITITTDEVEISPQDAETLIGAEPGQYVHVSVKDNGEGMDAETVTHTFDPYFTTKAEGRGTGLGLSTVYGIIKQNGANIYLTSHPGDGATVDMYFPPTTENVDETPARQASADHHSMSVLLVEDNDNVRAVVLDILEALGHTVSVFTNALGALAFLVEASSIDVVLSDIVMPGMSGRALADEVLRLFPRVRVVLMTGFSEEIVGEYDLNSRIRYLTKPFTSEDLTAALLFPE